MAVLKCKMCGGELDVVEGVTVIECEYCGTKQTVPTSKDENLQGLFNRANVLRMKSEFDKAEQLYEKIIEKDETQAEAYWGLILCKYGIEYVEDPATFKRIPTCHRTSYDSIIADEDYKSALIYADSVQRGIYEAEATEIDGIQKGILELSQKEEPYDVFICYKETDNDGKRTQDSVIANDIYHQLTQEGLKVFYAAITLENKIGSAYEPCIFAALNSAKVMLAIGTKPEHFNAVWVKNEWSRFLKIIQKDRSKLLIPCYRDIDAYELPEEFAHLQAQDMSRIGFINDIVRGIKKVVTPEEPKQTVVKETDTVGANSNTAPLLERVFMFLEDGDWNSANEYCEKVLDIEPKCAEAYLGKLMADLHIKKQDALKNIEEPFNDNNNYQKAIRFGSEKLKTELQGYISYIKERNEEARKDGIYFDAKASINENTIDGCNKAIQLFKTILSHKDAESLITLCEEKIIELKNQADIDSKNSVYKKGLHLMETRIISSYKSALVEFESISDWKDSADKISECKKVIKKLTEEREQCLKEQKEKEEQERIEREKQEQAERKEKARIAKRNKSIVIIATSAVCIIVAFIIALNLVIIPNNKYNRAVALMEAGKYEKAKASFEKLNGYKASIHNIRQCEIGIIDNKYNSAVALKGAGNYEEAFYKFNELNGYKDSAKKARELYDKFKAEKLKAANVGDSVLFGTYEQDNILSDGGEYIEWYVLEKSGGRMLVLSKYALDRKQYNTSYTNVTWETCTLRKWLNNDFISMAFSDDEKAMIPTVAVPADKNPVYTEDDPGEITQDQVFLLSIAELDKADEYLLCEPTDYVINNGWKRRWDNTCCWWWLRTPGGNKNSAARVGDEYEYYHINSDMAVDPHGGSVNNKSMCVRPAMWIDLNKL